MDTVTGRPGQLNERLLDLVDRPEPQLRAVATTLLIKAVDIPGEEMSLMESMVASDDAAVMIDPVAAARARTHLRRRLLLRLEELAVDYGESRVVQVMRDHLSAQIERWGTRAVDDADNRPSVFWPGPSGPANWRPPNSAACLQGCPPGSFGGWRILVSGGR
jgi:hypothetical protein